MGLATSPRPATCWRMRATTPATIRRTSGRV